MADLFSLDIQTEELVETLTEAVCLLTRRGIRCLRCGEPDPLPHRI